MSHPPRKAEPDLPPVPYLSESFTFLSKDGLRLSGVHDHTNSNRKGTILAFHYLGGSKRSIYTYVEHLLRHGYDVVSFDYPNHGQSGTRRSNRYTLEDDLGRFIQELHRRGVSGPFGTMGFSMGASLAFAAADYLPELKAVVADSGPLLFVKDYFLHVLRNKKVKNNIERAFFLFFYLHIIGFYRMSGRMIKRLRRLRGLPALFIHGERDGVITLHDAQTAYGLIQSCNTQMEIVERSHHLTNRCLMGDRYDEIVLQFFDRWLHTDGQKKSTAANCDQAAGIQKY